MKQTGMSSRRNAVLESCVPARSPPYIECGFIQHVRGTLPGWQVIVDYKSLLSLARMMPRPKNREKLCEYYNMGSKECREFLRRSTGLAQPDFMSWAALAFLFTFVHT